MLDWAEKALGIMEAQSRNHAVGGVDYRHHMKVRAGLAEAVRRGAANKALRDKSAGRLQELGLIDQD
jgi:hypothetical protein